jgi:hypothetical protein
VLASVAELSCRPPPTLFELLFLACRLQIEHREFASDERVRKGRSFSVSVARRKQERLPNDLVFRFRI